MIEFLTKVSRGSRNFAGELQNHTEHLHGRKFDSGILCKDGDDGGKIKKERMKIMAINYSSTRGGENNVTASMAILKGLAADGGLFMPDHIPALDCSLEELSHKTYQEVAYAVMSSPD